jgi:hypothetical protein
MTLRGFGHIVALVSIVLFGVDRTPLLAQEALTNQDVLEMVQADLGEDLIGAAIRTRSTSFDLSPRALIELREQGVPDSILRAMVMKMSAGRAVADSGDQEVVIADGTQVRLRLLQTVSSASAKVEDRVVFEAVEDITVDGVTVVAAGARGEGTVTRAQRRKSFGRRGRLDFSIDTVETVDGQKVPLRFSRSLRGKDLYGTAGVVTILTGPFGVFVKGKNVEVTTGTEYTIFVDGDRAVGLTDQQG